MYLESYEFQNENKKLVFTTISNNGMIENWTLISKSPIQVDDLVPANMMTVQKLTDGSVRSVKFEGEVTICLAEKKLHLYHGKRTELTVFPETESRSDKLTVETGFFERDYLKIGTFYIQGIQVEHIPFILNHICPPQDIYDSAPGYTFHWVEDNRGAMNIWTTNIPDLIGSHKDILGLARSMCVKINQKEHGITFELGQTIYEGLFRLKLTPPCLIRLLDGTKTLEFYDQKEQQINVCTLTGAFDADGQLCTDVTGSNQVNEMRYFVKKKSIVTLNSVYKGVFENSWLIDGSIELYHGDSPQFYIGKFSQSLRGSADQLLQQRQSVYHDPNGRHYHFMGERRAQLCIGFHEGAHPVNESTGKKEFYDLIIENSKLASISKVEMDPSSLSVKIVWHLNYIDGLLMLMSINDKSPSDTTRYSNKPVTIPVIHKMDVEKHRLFETVNQDLVYFNILPNSPSKLMPVNASQKSKCKAQYTTDQVSCMQAAEVNAKAMRDQLIIEEMQLKQHKKEQEYNKHKQQRQEKENKQKVRFIGEQQRFFHQEREQRQQQVCLREASAWVSLVDRFFRDTISLHQSVFYAEKLAKSQELQSEKHDQMQTLSRQFQVEHSLLVLQEQEAIARERLSKDSNVFYPAWDRPQKKYYHPRFDELGKLVSWYEMPNSAIAPSLAVNNKFRFDYTSWKVLPSLINVDDLPDKHCDLSFFYRVKNQGLTSFVVQRISNHVHNQGKYFFWLSTYTPERRELVRTFFSSAQPLNTDISGGRIESVVAEIERTIYITNSNGLLVQQRAERWNGVILIQSPQHWLYQNLLFKLDTGEYITVIGSTILSYNIHAGSITTQSQLRSPVMFNTQYYLDDLEEFKLNNNLCYTVPRHGI